MSKINLVIGGREFAVACAPGEEEHVTMLGRMVDKRVRQLGDDPTRLSEGRMMLFAALLLADDLHEAHTALPPALPSSTADPAAISRLAALAERIEKLAGHLEDMAANA